MFNDIDKYVYICYSHSDRTTAEKFKNAIKKAGMAVRMLPDSISPDLNFMEAANLTISNCAVFLVLLSEKSQGSESVGIEVGEAIALRKPMCAVKIEDCALTGRFIMMMGHMQIINCFDDPLPVVAHVKKLIESPPPLLELEPNKNRENRAKPKKKERTALKNDEKYIFISYKAEERSTADKFKTALENAGVKVWIAPDSVPLGSNYVKSIAKAIRGSAAVLVLLSEKSQNSDWVQSEVEMAKGSRIPIFPVRIENSEITDEFRLLIGIRQTVDCFGDYDRIVHAVSDIVDMLVADEAIGLNVGIRRHIITNGDRYGGYSFAGNADLCIKNREPKTDTDGDGLYGQRCEPRKDADSVGLYGQRCEPRTDVDGDVLYGQRCEPRAEPYKSDVCVVGVGGAGCNIANGLAVGEFDRMIFVNTDRAAIGTIKAATNIVIGKKVTMGFGAGGDPEKGMRAASESLDEIKEQFDNGCDTVFMLAGLGGGTGSGASPVIAQAAKSCGKTVVAFVVTPFIFEGKTRAENAEQGLSELRKYADSVVIFKNGGDLSVVDKRITVADMFGDMNATIRNNMIALKNILVKSKMRSFNNKNTYGNVLSVLRANGGDLFIGEGRARGEYREINALRSAVNVPYSGLKTIENAKRAFMFFECDGDVVVSETSSAVDLLKCICAPDCDINVYFETCHSAFGEIRLTVIMSHFCDSII